MNRSIRILASLVTPMVVFAACSKGGGNGGSAATDTTAAAPAPPAPPASAAASASAGVTDPQIAAIVLAANSADSAAGILAGQKGTNAKVKEFGQRMVTDHSGVNRQAVALAGKLGVTPEQNPTSQQLQQGGEQNVQHLGGLSGAAFDTAYIDHEVQYHQTVLQAIDGTLIPGAHNAELKALLQQVRPAVAAHLQMATDIQKQLRGG